MTKEKIEKNKKEDVKEEEKKSEEDILKMILEKDSWEEILYYIVSLENLDPWNVDLVKLSESFLRFLKSVQELDFRIPAKIVFVATILLKLKADHLSIFETEEIKEALRERRPFEELGIDPNLIQLGYAVKRVPKRQITLNELVVALRKALTISEKKLERKRVWQAEVRAELDIEEDITWKIKILMEKIEKILKELKTDKLEFRRLVNKWTREEIVSNFVPLLHLDQSEKIKTDQPEIFKEIYITKR